jgi:dihydrofolate reductase
MIISIIAAIGKNNEIGQNNRLLCRLPADLKHFKQITWGHTVVMGRKTFESLPNGPLPHRKNIVISSSVDLKPEGAKSYPSLDFVFTELVHENEIFIIGGSQIYQQLLPRADKLYLTQIHADFPEADAFFPKINYNEWQEISRENHYPDEKNLYSYSFLVYEKK